MAAALWFASDGSAMVDLNEVIAADWRKERTDDDGDRVRLVDELFVWFRVDSDDCLTLPRDIGNELMAALRRHAQWPEGQPYRG